MTTARVFNKLVDMVNAAAWGAVDGAAAGALSAVVGVAASKAAGTISETTPRDSFIGAGALGLGLVGSIFHAYQEYNDRLDYPAPQKNATQKEKYRDAFLKTFLATGAGMIGGQLLSLLKLSNPPLEELAPALLIGSIILFYGNVLLESRCKPNEKEMSSRETKAMR